MTSLIINLARRHEQDGIPFEISINSVLDKGHVVNFIMEYNIALWRGFTHKKFMSLLKEGLQISRYSKSDCDIILSKLNEYVVQRERPTEFNLFFLTESKKLSEDERLIIPL